MALAACRASARDFSRLLLFASGLLVACADMRPMTIGEPAAFGAECSTCHGNAENPAPPQATNGDTGSDSVRVGAHQQHLHDGSLRTAIACDECHIVPAAVEDAGHQDQAFATVTFGALATAAAAAPVWSHSAATCTGAYCHGATLAGGTNKQPKWTVVDGSQIACDTCHGAPPPPPHAAADNCASCHGGTVTSGTTINIAGGLHMNGRVDAVAAGGHPDGWDDPTQHGYAANEALASCKSCHGDDLLGGNAGVSCDSCHTTGWRSDCTFCHGDKTSGRSSPPDDTHGRTATTLVSVGAHASHFGPTIAHSINCSECHTPPADISAPTHINGQREVVFGELAKTGAAGPTWSESSGRCSNAYCHGKFTGGNLSNQPLWTTVNGSQKSCTSCHGDPPSTGHHSTHRNEGIGCSNCHAGYSTTGVNTATHVNGVKDVSQSSWNGTSCDPSCHGRETW
jgi:predicted CxxxxCH...CXXCH cytochrome family protein